MTNDDFDVGPSKGPPWWERLDWITVGAWAVVGTAALAAIVGLMLLVWANPVVVGGAVAIVASCYLFAVALHRLLVGGGDIWKDGKR